MGIEQEDQQKQGYISVEEAAVEIHTSRSNLYYYANQMGITPRKFALDRRTYIRRSDLERIKVAKGVATTSTHISSEDVLVFLAGLGLAVTPHSDPSYGWGYSWQGGDWEGPYETPTAAIQGAFDRAVRDRETVHHRMPFLTHEPKLFWWDGTEWYTARRSNGIVEVFTGDIKKNDGYERLEDVEEQREVWLRPMEPTGDGEFDEERQRARLAANILYTSHKSYYRIDPIDWQQEGLKANVCFNGVQLGDLLTVYNHLREEENFITWLRSKGVTK